MRPQQNRRMRGRGNNSNNNQNRRGPNPLTRSYESNGPDVKIRGSAQQIAEKYAALARDAQSSGDRVMAENYLQHAEHYNRIIAAAQAQFAQQHQRDLRDDQDDDGEDDREGFEPANDQPRRVVQDGSGPQPVIEGTPAEVALEQGQMPSNDDDRRRAANGNGGPHGAGEDDEGGAPRRSRRSRRGGRSREGAEAKPESGDAGAAASPEGEAPPILVPVQD